jgi:hypothetical protein
MLTRNRGRDLLESIFASPSIAMHAKEVPPYGVKANNENVLDGFERRHSEKVKFLIILKRMLFY